LFQVLIEKFEKKSNFQTRLAWTWPYNSRIRLK